MEAPCRIILVAKPCLLCRMRHRRHYAASRTMPHGSRVKVLEGPQDAGFIAHGLFKMRHSLEALELELFEESEQLVVGLVAFGSAFDGVGLGQGLFLQRQVGIEIDLSGFD